MKNADIKKSVRDAYGNIAKGESNSCCGPSTDCAPDTGDFAKKIGYSDEELDTVPEGANLGLSCGNPTALGVLKEGHTVVDLGAGAGFDSFIAAKKVGPTGHVIGIDMTHEMLEKARANALKTGGGNVEFRLGEIEHLPVADNSVDVVISNCVINLSTDKAAVFSEVVRILRPGGRIAISDMALLKELPAEVRESVDHYVGCVSGAVHIDEYRRLIEEAGLEDVTVSINGSSNCSVPDTEDPVAKAVLDALPDGETLEDSVASILVQAVKP